MHADQFCNSVSRILGGNFFVKWTKKTTDKYTIHVYANETGQRFDFTVFYDDFRALDPNAIAFRAFERLEGQARRFLDRASKTKEIPLETVMRQRRLGLR